MSEPQKREPRVMVWTPLDIRDALPEGAAPQDAGHESEYSLLMAYSSHCEKEMEAAFPYLELVMSWGLSGDDGSGRITCADCEDKPRYDPEHPCPHEMQVNEALKAARQRAQGSIRKEGQE